MIFFFNVSNLHWQSFFNVQRLLKKGPVACHQFCQVQRSISQVCPGFVVWGCTNLFFIVFLYCDFLFWGCTTFSLFVLFIVLSFCLKRWGGIISCCFFFVVLGYSSFLSLFCSCLFWGVFMVHHLVLLTFPASACFRPQEKKDNSPTNPGAEKIWMKPGCHQRF